VTGVRVMAVDLGERRIGIAASDATGVLATPAGVVVRSGDRATDHARLAARAAELEAGEVVVGLPVSLSGRVGPAARRVLEEVEELREVLGADGLSVHVHDERLSTVSAERALRTTDRRSAAVRRRSGDLDSAAAAVVLQSWLDSRRDDRER